MFTHLQKTLHVSLINQLGLMLAIALFITWGVWFITAPIPVYTHSKHAQVIVKADTPLLTASFSSQEPVKVNQEGYFIPADRANQRWKVIITEIIRDSQTGQVQAEMQWLDNDHQQPYVGLSGQVEIITERLTPLNLILRDVAP